ncbi:hypothetical protein AVEN_159435-1 [Araneus ventricosus]|uniref:Uncharacterized protein n=1 Tax=Araneus ventricosus TaxID=182803 RepID=A0A4Y2A104_ARAVE|nr:hypothetical protein AVEN_159435-1 [Araneus ventricosus]
MKWTPLRAQTRFNGPFLKVHIEITPTWRETSDGRCNCSSAETGVLVAITDHGPTLPVGGTHYHRQKGSPSHYCTHQGSETPLTYPVASHSRTRGATQ